MRWQGRPEPENFEESDVIEFAWVPTRMSDGTMVWLEKYRHRYSYSRTFERWFSWHLWPLPVLLALLLTGCGGTVDVAWTSPLGITMARTPNNLHDYFTPEQVDLHAKAVVAAFVEAGYDEALLRQGVDWMVVVVYPGPLLPSDGCTAPGGLCNGVTLDHGVKVRMFPCVWNTTLRHEMTHQMEGWITEQGTYDYRHVSPYWTHADEPLGVCND